MFKIHKHNTEGIKDRDKKKQLDSRNTFRSNYKKRLYCRNLSGSMKGNMDDLITKKNIGQTISQKVINLIEVSNESTSRIESLCYKGL